MSSLLPVAPTHAPSQASHPPVTGRWPPGPSSGLFGVRLLRQMSRDLLGALRGWQARYGDLVHLRIVNEHEVIVTDPALARELLVNHHDALVRWERGVSVFAQVHGHSVLVAEGEAWRRKRQTLQPAFTPKAVQSFVPAMAASVAESLGEWPQAHPRWPIEGSLTSLAMSVITRMLFSVPLGEDNAALADAIHRISVEANSEFYWPASWPDAMPWKRGKRKALAVLRDFIDRQVRARLPVPPPDRPDDLLTRLLQLHADDDQAWPLQAVRDECMTAFLAGHETVAATLTWWSWCMAAHPEAQREAADEVRRQLRGREPAAQDVPLLRRLTCTLHETMRLYPAAPVLLSRRSTRPITLGGWQLPARTMFMVPVQLMQQDPRWFVDPLAFRPQRFAPEAAEIPRGAHLPLGVGPRVCLGQHLAMNEMVVVTAALLQRYTLSVPEGDAPPEPLFNVTLRPGTPLHLRLSPAGEAGI